ncbi:MAG: DUF2277 domain-containing protein [Chloroflexota bacterium]
MCRSIKTLRNAEIPATEEEIRAAALQYVRKVSGYRKPSRVNAEAFERAVEEVAEATRRIVVHPKSWTVVLNKVHCSTEGVQYASKTEFQR